MDLASFVAPGSAEAEKKHQEKIKLEEKQRQEKLKEKEAEKSKGLLGKDASPAKEKEEDSYRKHLTKDGFMGRPFGSAFTCVRCGTMAVSASSGMSSQTVECLTGGAHNWKPD